jgi:spore coat polysaccharide biosynthesis predicted glycosyltransferase SpsG
VVVDHYAIDATWHRRLQQATGARLLAIDDLADRELAVDAVLDHNPAADHRAKYRAVLKDRPAAEVAVLGGPAYALIDAVYRQHAARPFDATVRSLGLFMGGTDPGGHSLWALQACREHAGWRGLVHLATTSSNPRIAELRAAAAQDAGVQLWIDQPHLAAFHASHDLQVGAGGGALWERCALGVPTLALITAANQRLSVPWLAEAGVVVGFDALQRDEARQAELGATVARLIAAPAERAALRERSLAWVDGRGAERAAVTILALKT